MSALNAMFAQFNLNQSEKLPQARQFELQQVRDVFDRISKSLQVKRDELEASIERKFQKLIEQFKKERQRVLTKKAVMERNYNLLETALEAVPLPILSCEEGLLSGILLANQNLMKGVKKKAQIQKSRSASPIGGAAEKDAEGGFGDALDQAEFANLTSFGGGLGGGARLKTLESHATRIDTIFSDL